MINIEKLVNAHILSLKPYSSARDEFSGTQQNLIFLDANENATVQHTALDSNVCFNRYPDPHHRILKNQLAQLKKLNPNQILLGNGSDECIDLIYRCFCSPSQSSTIICSPTYGMYEVYAHIHQVSIIQCPLTLTFDLDIPTILSQIAPHTKIIWICSPNNPTGNCMRPEDILQLLENFNGIVVVDEAYIDFADKPTAVALLSQYKNLIVIQTLSKAWGLANLRVGMVLADAYIIDILHKIKPPYNISGATQSFVEKVLEQPDEVQQSIRQTIQNRTKLAAALAKIKIVEHVFHSDANFLLTQLKPDASLVYNYLIRKGLIVRNRSQVSGCKNCLRITVGTALENDYLIKTLNQYPN